VGMVGGGELARGSVELELEIEDILISDQDVRKRMGEGDRQSRGIERRVESEELEERLKLIL
jgi:hypothetical protein